MAAIQRLPFRNPVLGRELRQRMNTPRIMLVITLYLAVLGAIVFSLYQARTGERTGGFGQPGVTEIASIGQSLFEFVLFFMALLVLFIVPGFTAASIAGERERQTLRALQVSLLSPRSIVLGKVGASVALTVLLLIASLPLLAVAYLVGGITFSEIFISLGVLLFGAFALACITVGCSALVKRVPGAILLAYGVVLLLAGGTFIAWGVWSEVDASRGVDAASPPSWIMAPNPLAAVADVAERTVDDNNGNEFFGPFGPSYSNVESPLSAIRQMMEPDWFSRGGVFFEEDVAFANGQPIPVPVPPGFDRFGNPINQRLAPSTDRIPFLAEYFIVFSVLALVGLLVAVWRIRTPAKTER